MPGIRVPLTADADLFSRAVALGARVIWLHSYGQRFVDPAAGRPHKAPRMDKAVAPRVAAGHPIPSTPDDMPDRLDYDATTQQLRVGTGFVQNVTSRMWAYDVSGVNVLGKWFSYRRRTRDRPVIGGRRVSPLQEIQAEAWQPEYTSELIDLLNVPGLLADLEAQQAELLDRIVEGPQITVTDLTEAGVLPVPDDARKPSKKSAPQNTTDALFNVDPR